MTIKSEIPSSRGQSLGTAVDQAMVIAVVSDVVCPWCLIGKRRLEKALKLLEREDMQIHWRPFELNPDIPKEGVNRQEYRIRKCGSLSYARQLEARVAAAGAEEGIKFRFDRIERMPNTLDAHRLIWLAAREGLQNAVVERLFDAYFIDGKDVGKHEVLRGIGKESGLDSGSVDSLLASNFGTAEIFAEEGHARARGVNGVPTFFINDVPIASGAQKPELLASVLRPALEPALEQCSPQDGACG
jgi:predicted DsbA family dithiol-disulfide isomerase